MRPGDTYHEDFSTVTSAGTNVWADSLPTGLFFINSVLDNTVTVTITTNAMSGSGTGTYSLSATVPASYTNYLTGTSTATIRVYLSATVGGVTYNRWTTRVELIQYGPQALPNTTIASTGVLATTGNTSGFATAAQASAIQTGTTAILNATTIPQGQLAASSIAYGNISGSSVSTTGTVWLNATAGSYSVNDYGIPAGWLLVVQSEQSGVFTSGIIKAAGTIGGAVVSVTVTTLDFAPTGGDNFWVLPNQLLRVLATDGSGNALPTLAQVSGVQTGVTSLASQVSLTATGSAMTAVSAQVSGVQTGVTSIISQVSGAATGASVTNLSAQVSGVQAGVLVAVTNSANASTISQVSGTYSGLLSQGSNTFAQLLVASTSAASASTVAQVSATYTGLSSSITGVSSQVSSTYTSSANTYSLLSTVSGNVGTLLARIPSSLSGVIAALSGITGTGANTVLGYFQSLFRADVSASTDLGGSATSAANSLQAIAIDVSGSSGSGAYPVTAYVTDGTSALQGATVRFAEGAAAYYASSNTSGAASFSLNAATYLLTVTKFGYQFTPASELITGVTTVTCTMTPTTVAQPTNPNLANVVLASLDGSGNDVPGTTFTLRLMASDGTPNTGELGDEFEAVTGTNGLTPTLQLIRGATYSIKGGTAGQPRTFTVPATGSVSVPGFVVRSV